MEPCLHQLIFSSNEYPANSISCVDSIEFNSENSIDTKGFLTTIYLLTRTFGNETLNVNLHTVCLRWCCVQDASLRVTTRSSAKPVTTSLSDRWWVSREPTSNTEVIRHLDTINSSLPGWPRSEVTVSFEFCLNGGNWQYWQICDQFLRITIRVCGQVIISVRPFCVSVCLN